MRGAWWLLVLPVLAGADGTTGCGRTPITIPPTSDVVTVTRISANDSIGNEDVAVTSNERGDFVVVWSQINAPGWSTVYGARFVPGAGWLPQQDLRSTMGGNVVSPAVAVDPSGNAVAVWKEQWVVDGGTMPAIFWNRFAVGAAGWGDAGPLHDFEGGFNGASNPFVAASTTGSVVVTWAYRDPSARVVSGASGTLGAVIVLSDGGGAGDTVGALDSSGNLLAAWRNGYGEFEWLLRAFDGGTVATGNWAFSGYSAELTDPPVFDPSGNGFLLFTISDSFNRHLLLFRMERQTDGGIGTSMTSVAASVQDDARMVLDETGRGYAAYRYTSSALNVVSFTIDGGLSDAGSSADAVVADESMFDLVVVPDAGVRLVWFVEVPELGWGLASARVGPGGTIGTASRTLITPKMDRDSPDALSVATDRSGRSIVVFSYVGDMWAGEIRF